LPDYPHVRPATCSRPPLTAKRFKPPGSPHAPPFGRRQRTPNSVRLLRIECVGTASLVNRVDRGGAALKGGWTFLVNTTTRAVARTVGDPDQLDFETAMGRAMPAHHRR